MTDSAPTSRPASPQISDPLEQFSPDIVDMVKRLDEQAKMIRLMKEKMDQDRQREEQERQDAYLKRQRELEQKAARDLKLEEEIRQIKELYARTLTELSEQRLRTEDAEKDNPRIVKRKSVEAQRQLIAAKKAAFDKLDQERKEDEETLERYQRDYETARDQAHESTVAAEECRRELELLEATLAKMENGDAPAGPVQKFRADELPNMPKRSRRNDDRPWEPRYVLHGFGEPPAGPTPPSVELLAPVVEVPNAEQEVESGHQSGGESDGSGVVVADHSEQAEDGQAGPARRGGTNTEKLVRWITDWLKHCRGRGFVLERGQCTEKLVGVGAWRSVVGRVDDESEWVEEMAIQPLRRAFQSSGYVPSKCYCSDAMFSRAIVKCPGIMSFDNHGGDKIRLSRTVRDTEGEHRYTYIVIRKDKIPLE